MRNGLVPHVAQFAALGHDAEEEGDAATGLQTAMEVLCRCILRPIASALARDSTATACAAAQNLGRDREKDRGQGGDGGKGASRWCIDPQVGLALWVGINKAAPVVPGPGGSAKTRRQPHLQGNTMRGESREKPFPAVETPTRPSYCQSHPPPPFSCSAIRSPTCLPTPGVTAVVPSCISHVCLIGSASCRDRPVEEAKGTKRAQ